MVDDPYLRTCITDALDTHAPMIVAISRHHRKADSFCRSLITIVCVNVVSAPWERDRAMPLLSDILHTAR